MIGVFDSGVGGMTVARAIEQALPEVRLLYFGDLARTPYGSKSAGTITEYARQNTEFLLAKGARVIVIACNSAASVASETVRREFAVPVYEVISPAVRLAVSTTKTGRIGIIGTRATVASGVYERKIREQSQELKVFSQACPLLVPLVEEDWLGKPETKMVLRRYLQPLKTSSIDTLVLGCTHYPLAAHLIAPRIGRQVRIIDSSAAIAAELRDLAARTPDLFAASPEEQTDVYYVSDLTPTAATIARRIFGREINLQLAHI